MSAGPPRVDAWAVEHLAELHGTLLDTAFAGVSRLVLLLPLWIGIALAIAVRRRAVVAAGAALGAIALADGVSALAKAAIGRPRPAAELTALVPLVPTPGSAALPSGHATMAFAAALALGALEPRLRIPLLALAVLVAASRVWLGVHYPTDVIAGAVLGTLVGLGGAAAVRRATRAAPTSGAAPR